MTARRPPTISSDGGVGQEAVELAQLVVDLDPQGHEGARRRVDPSRPLATGSTAQRGGDHVGQATGRGRTGGDHRRRDPAGLGLLAVLAQDPRQAPGVDLGQQLGRARASGRIHPHVQGPVSTEREPPLRAIELHRRDPQVGHDGPHLAHPERGQRLGDGGEARVHEIHRARSIRQAASGQRQRVGVSIEQDRPSRPHRLQHGGRVTAQARGDIDQYPRGRRSRQRRAQRGADLLRQHGNVSYTRLAHEQKPLGRAHFSAPGSNFRGRRLVRFPLGSRAFRRSMVDRARANQ